MYNIIEGFGVNEAFLHMSISSIIYPVAKRCVVLLSIIVHLEP